MKIYDCSELNSNSNSNFNLHRKFDFCIIGAGISGVILADQLSHKFNVCILESGDFSMIDKVQELNELAVSAHPIRKNFQNRVRQYGGACNIWAGRSLILNSIDFEERDWIENSGWPIKEGELSKYYSLLFDEYGMFDYKYFNKYKYDDFDDDLYKSIFENSEFSSIKAGWSKNIVRFGKNSKVYKNFMKNKNITLFKNATVEKLSNSNNLVDSCQIKLNSIDSIYIKAKKFVLSTGGLENARILLSSSDEVSNGIGNEFDNVGRYYMDHPTYVRKDIRLNKKIYNSSLFLKPLENGRFKNNIRFSEDIQRKQNLTNNNIELSPQYPQIYEDTFETVVQLGKFFLQKNKSLGSFKFNKLKLSKVPEIIYLLSPNEITPNFITKFYYKFNKMMKRPISCNNIVLSHHLEQTPNPRSRVTLNHEKNYLGINKLNLNWVIDPNEIETANLLENKVIDNLKKTGWVSSEVEYKEIDVFKDASHHMGTTRMSVNPKNGVVDTNCKVFSVNNLFIAGSSVFPTSGNANPTYTIAALTLRLAHYLKNNHD
jgi:choline dehydrogenase-like flavoprotein